MSKLTYTSMDTLVKKIKPLRDRGNWLLCTLNAALMVAVNAALSIVLTNEAGGLMVLSQVFLVSTALMVAFGEIIPQSICSRYALYIVWFLMVYMAVLAWPISWLLDVLGEELGPIYSNSELSKLVEIADTAAIMKGALELNEKHVHEMNNVFWLNVLTKIFNLGHSRIQDAISQRPLCVGLLYVKDLILVDPDDNITITKVPIDVWRGDNLQTCMQMMFEKKQAQRESVRLAGGTDVKESRHKRYSSRSQKDRVEEVAGVLTESIRLAQQDEEMSCIRGHQKLSMIEASESSSYCNLDDDAERSDTTDTKPQRGMMSETDDEEEPPDETRYSIQISPLCFCQICYLLVTILAHLILALSDRTLFILKENEQAYPIQL